MAWAVATCLAKSCAAASFFVFLVFHVFYVAKKMILCCLSRRARRLRKCFNVHAKRARLKFVREADLGLFLNVGGQLRRATLRFSRDSGNFGLANVPRSPDGVGLPRSGRFSRSTVGGQNPRRPAVFGMVGNGLDERA